MAEILHANPLPDRLRELYPFQSHHVEVDEGLRMHYVDEGRGDDVALLLHGNPTWSFLYRNVIPGLRASFRVIAPDHVGFGLSDKSTDPDYYSLERHVTNLTRFAERLDLKDVTLVVHDWGGPIGLGWAVRNPERVKRIVFLNTLVFPPRRERPLSAWHGFFASPMGRFLAENLNLVTWSAMRFGVAKRLPRKVMAAYRHPFPDAQSRVGPRRFVEMVPNGPDHPTAALLREFQEGYSGLVAKPATLVWGEADPVMPAKLVKRFQETFPNIRHTEVVPKVSHFVQEDVPEAVTRAIRELQKQA